MTAEYWLVAAFGLAVALGIGFMVGRRSAPTQHEVESAQKERDEASAEVDRVRTEITRHFEESASMFGKLADDYRTFFEQFARTAQNLGLSEGQARELLRQADPRLIARQANVTTPTEDTRAEDTPVESAETARRYDDGDENAPIGFEAAAPQSVGGEESLAEEEAPSIGEEAPGEDGEREVRDRAEGAGSRSA